MTPLLSGAEDVQVRADDRKGVLVISGPKEKVAQFETYAHIFDVHPVTLRFQIEIDSPADHSVKKTVTEVDNDETWSQTDSNLDVGLEVTPRINDDGTVTIFATTRFGATSQTFVTRMRLGETQYIRPGFFAATESTVGYSPAGSIQTIQKLDDKCVPVVHLKIER